MRSFLATHCEDGVILPGGDKIVERYARFREGLADTCAELHVQPGELTFRDLSTLIVAWLENHPLSRATAS